jgi:hypothetical protein
MAHAYRGEFEQALAKAQQVRMPGLFMDLIAWAAALGHLGRQAEARSAVAVLLQLLPDFEENGQETIRRIWRYQQSAEILLQELGKAGLEF